MGPMGVLQETEIEQIEREIRRNPVSAADIVPIIRAAGRAAARGVPVRRMTLALDKAHENHDFRPRTGENGAK